MSSSWLNKTRDKTTFIFKIWFFVYTFLGTNTFLRESFLVSICMWPMFLLAGVLCIDRLFHYKNYIKTPCITGLIALCISAFVSMLINWQYGFKENFINLILWCIYFFLLYTNDQNKTKEIIIKECEVLGIIVIVYMAVGTIVAFVMMAVGYSGSQIATDGYEVFSGFAIGRLWGMFLNLNTASVTSNIAIALSIYFILKKKNVILRSVLGINIIVQILYITFSDSRIGRVCLCALVGIIVLLKGYYLCSKRHYLFTVGVVFCSLLVIGIAYWIPVQVKEQYNFWVIANSQNENSQIENEEEIEKNTSANLIERGYDMSGDISNRRFDVWRSGWEIFISRPIFGVSFKGFTQYAVENMPDTYIVNNDYKQMTTLDNEIMNILVSQGLVGLIILMFVVVGILRLVVPQLLKLASDINFCILCFSIVFILCISAMTVSTMFYNSTPNANCFWIFLGALVFLAKKNDIERSKFR